MTLGRGRKPRQVLMQHMMVIVALIMLVFTATACAGGSPVSNLGSQSGVVADSDADANSTDEASEVSIGTESSSPAESEPAAGDGQATLQDDEENADDDQDSDKSNGSKDVTPSTQEKFAHKYKLTGSSLETPLLPH